MQNNYGAVLDLLKHPLHHKIHAGTNPIFWDNAPHHGAIVPLLEQI